MQECSSPANNWLPLRGPSCSLPVRNWSSLKCSEFTQFLACASGGGFCSPRNSGFASAEAQRPRQARVRRAWGRRCRMSSARASQRRPHSCGWWVTLRYRSCLHSRTCTPVTKARRQGKESEQWEREERLKQRATEGSFFSTRDYIELEFTSSSSLRQHQAPSSNFPPDWPGSTDDLEVRTNLFI